jgi:hypothetical protein
MTAATMTIATPVRAAKDDVALLDRDPAAIMNTIARDCRQPGCRAHAGWLVRTPGVHQVVPLCTRDASRRIRRRALPGRWPR